MKNSRRLVLGLVFLTSTPLSWGEDVFSSEVERSLFVHSGTASETHSDDETGKIIIRRNGNLVRYKDSAPTFKPIQLDVSSIGREICFDGSCMPAWTASGGSDQVLTVGPGLLEAGFQSYQFVLASLQFGRAFINSGTCTKF